MPDQRSPSKQMLGAYVDLRLIEAVDRWCERERKPRSRFLVEACVEKLEGDGIEITRDVMDERRRTLPIGPQAPHGLSSKPSLRARVEEASRLARADSLREPTRRKHGEATKGRGVRIGSRSNQPRAFARTPATDADTPSSDT